jgi:hypothetical protein
MLIKAQPDAGIVSVLGANALTSADVKTRPYEVSAGLLSEMLVGALVEPPEAQLGLQVAILSVPCPDASVAVHIVHVMFTTAIWPVPHSTVNTVGSYFGGTSEEQSRTSGGATVVVVASVVVVVV